MAVLRRMPSPFNVNTFALECLAEALSDRKFVADYVAQVTQPGMVSQRIGRAWLQMLAEHCQFCFAVLAKRKNHSGRDAARGISLRDRPDCEGCVRITIGRQKEMERLIAENEAVLLNFPTPNQAAR